MRRKKLAVADCVGTALAHDLTRIVPGRVKEVAFHKGQIIRAQDLERLRDMGRANLYVLELGPEDVHENDAADQLAQAVAGPGVSISAPAEGKVNLTAAARGLLKVSVKGVAALNAINHLALSTLHTATPCEPGQLVASAKIVPLALGRAYLERAARLRARYGALVQVKPFLPLKVGAVITGSEIASGRIADGFDSAVLPRLERYGATVMDKRLVGDDPAAIAQAIGQMARAGAQLVLVTGGLSIDPDDRTRQGVRRAGARQVFYGTPVLPGAMFLYARLGQTPVLGLPACVFYNHQTVFDLLLPRFMAGESPTRAQICALGHGGLCQLCDTCSFPHCPFGKGGA